jgi:hypothetical protein
MRNTAERYIEDAARQGEPLPTVKGIKAKLKSINKYRCAAGFGIISIALYSLLYVFNTDLTHIAQDTHQGHKTWFFVPIVIALTFSLIHGSFTSHFWDALGVKAKK